ncbi:YgjP-like metallopeptidase domain-containing protein [Mycoplasmopsis pulmonis]|uniref:YgjP-like metallopeptidase domain-containing protein n=1 Tax=Mycoplasmopsis pulmonis TaxID=2107 RepID=UPI001004FD84|nr:M48 family metallopeptidase [Mycoplasmopsis pulmonis]VEU68090.1 Protein of uncharacterised function DUF45 [Mycoplasmopsis pulmonis]
MQEEIVLKKIDKDSLVFEDISQKQYEVKILKTHNIKNVYLSIIKGQITLRVPKNKILSNNEIINFVSKHISKLIKSFDKVQIQKEENFFLLFGIKTFFIYKNNILIIPDLSKVIRVKEYEKIDIYLKKIIKEIFLEYLKVRQKYWSLIMGVPEHSIEVREKNRSWASNYVSKKKIVYALKSSSKSYEWIDYLIIHELAHYKEQNHSSNFWKIVSLYCPNWKAMKKNN